MEYLNENNSYPFEDRNNLPNDLIIDACIFLPSPVYLTSIEKSGLETRFYINSTIYFVYSNQKDFIYNDYGKLVVGDINKIVYGNFYLKFLESVCYNPASISLNGLVGDIFINNPIDLTYNEISNNLYYINGQEGKNGNFTLSVDKCTNWYPKPGQIALNDICLPSCYDCNKRLTTGDVHKYMLELEQRVTELES